MDCIYFQMVQDHDLVYSISRWAPASQPAPLLHSPSTSILLVPLVNTEPSLASWPTMFPLPFISSGSVDSTMLQIPIIFPLALRP